MTELAFLLVAIAFTVLMIMMFGWPYLFLSVSFVLGWFMRGWVSHGDE